ncbi:MAG: glycosyltransferase [Acidobacteria bacterium]|nr:glycosyltransferase [Acidobacteriota bacterium]
MIAVLARLVLALSFIGLTGSGIFLILVVLGCARFKRKARLARKAALGLPRDSLPAVTILKPVHGMEERLSENLESFFRQDYPEYELIIGSRRADDPAIAVANELRRRYSAVKSRIVISGPPEWPNAKVFTLDKMLALSGTDFLVTSDSDVRVAPDFLRHVIPPLLDSRLGLVTCLYRGDPAGDFWSSLEALGMSVEMPSGVVVADMLEGTRFALGQAIALRRDALEAIGGIRATADYYSDDYVLGNLIWKAGYKVIFSHEFVEHVLTARPLVRTLGDQLRWMKSTRHSRPWGHIGAGLTFAMPFGILGLVAAILARMPAMGLWLLGIAVLNRIVQSLVVGWGLVHDRRALKRCWLYPLRDLQGFAVWAASFLSHNFYWRGEHYRFSREGRIIPASRQAVRETPVNV